MVTIYINESKIELADEDHLHINFTKEGCGFNIIHRGKLFKTYTRCHPEKGCPLFGSEKNVTS